MKRLADTNQSGACAVPERIQLRRTSGWRKPDLAVVVTRPGRWGNPFVVGRAFPAAWNYTGDGRTRVRDAGHAVDLFRALMRESPAQSALARTELAGRDLACWCPLDQPCHADVLLELANREET